MKKAVSTLLILFLFISCPLLSQEKKCACCTEEASQFDFWLGDWNVFNTGTQVKVGENRIEKIQDGCALKENWTSAGSNVTGTSFNYFDKKSKTWNQLWIDNSGGILKIEGSKTSNKMVLTSEPAFVESLNKTIVDRITWTENGDGSVRQFWQRREEGSEEWSVIFDGIYVRK